MRRSAFPCSVIAMLLAGAVNAASVSAVYAQGNEDASARAQSDGGESGAGFGKSGAPMAYVGAGTTNESTTGVSGPETEAEAAPGENSLPPLPSADLCEPYKGEPAYDACLWVVLKEK